RTSVRLRIIFADGSSFTMGGDPDALPAATVRFLTRRAERRVIAFGHVGMLESYFMGDIDVDGEFALAFRACMDAGFDGMPNPLVRLRNRWHEFRFSNAAVAQAKANARFHYGLGQAFFRLWLDRIGMM